MTLTTQLPDEIVIEVLLLLNLRDLLTCRLVSLLWCRTIDTDACFQYKLALQIAGMVDDPQRDVPYSDRLRTLRQHQKAWSALEWTQMLNIPKETRSVWELYGNVLAQNTTENGIKFFKIPSALRGIPESPPWEVHVDYKIRDFGMDPGANLLILLEVVPTDQATPHRNSSHIHLVTMSDGAPHPEARCPELKIAIEHYTQHWTYTIQTHGDYLGILYAPSPHVRSQSTYQLAIWNWRLGLVLARMSGNDIESFAFLDSRRFIVARIPPFEDQDVEFDDMQPYLELYSFVDVLDQPMPEQIPRILGILRYPTTGTGISSFDLTIRTDPASTWNPPESPSVPFHIANKNRIFIIQFYLDTVPHPRPIMHCIHISTLLELANRLEVESLQVQQDEIIDVPWEDWGPHGSRMWIDQVVSRNWVCYVYGSRWISFRIVRSKGGQPSLRITLRDFSTLGVRHGALMKQLAASTGTESHKSPAMDPRDVFTPPLGDKWTYHVNQDTTIDEEADLFADAISTSLPYREVSESLPPEIYSGGRVGVMMSEDAILLVEESNVANGQRHIKILSF